MNDIPLGDNIFSPEKAIPLSESDGDDVAAPVMTTTNGVPAIWSEESARLLHQEALTGEPRPITPTMWEAIRTYRRLTGKDTH